MACRGVNKAVLIGHVGQSPNIRQTKSGDMIANFSLATSATWKDAQGQVQERVEWHNIVAFKGIAKIVGEYVKKGDKLYICGEIKYRKYTDKNSIERNVTEINALEINLLSGNVKTKEVNGNYKPPQSDSDYDDDVPF